eukprot:3874638-Lingulodinium_polyedra.AAC.1
MAAPVCHLPCTRPQLRGPLATGTQPPIGGTNHRSDQRAARFAQCPGEPEHGWLADPPPNQQPTDVAHAAP